MSFSIVAEMGKPPFSTTPASEGKVPDAFAISRASSTSLRSPATTTMAPSSRRVSTFSIDMPAMTTLSASRCSSAGSPLISRPSHAAMMVPTVGATSTRSSGIVHTGMPARSAAETEPRDVVEARRGRHG